MQHREMLRARTAHFPSSSRAVGALSLHRRHQVVIRSYPQAGFRVLRHEKKDRRPRAGGPARGGTPADARAQAPASTTPSTDRRMDEHLSPRAPNKGRVLSSPIGPPVVGDAAQALAAGMRVSRRASRLVSSRPPVEHSPAFDNAPRSKSHARGGTSHAAAAAGSIDEPRSAPGSPPPPPRASLFGCYPLLD